MGRLVGLASFFVKAKPGEWFFFKEFELLSLGA
jgi:hypothetical protein